MARSQSVDGIDARLKEFVDEHIHGWSHEDWNHLMEGLSNGGHDISDPKDVGLRLERAHILATLERLALPGIGAKRREHVADRYASLWQLRHASVEELTELPTFHRGLAETLHDGLARRTGGF